ncbi:MAG: threonine synthase [Propionibacteriaceae bacterium]|jgi:threonine synthase|nr:threonine synthase [Propionibacteriaceae bacterium]
MMYLSTRDVGAQSPAGFSDILLEGLAPDGGLYWPQTLPRLGRGERRDLRRLYADWGYPRLAWAVLRRFTDDIPEDDLWSLCRRAYTTAKFGSPDAVSVAELGDGLWLGRLSNGPTAAFKDLAMQLLAELFEYELERRQQRMTIIGATSGDTGSAAEVAMLGKSRVQVFMLSPQGRMTPFQRGQMYGLDDPGIVNITVPGSFDDCQDLVKAVSSDADFKAAHAIGTVNSINWARLAAQVVYYIALWLELSADDDESVSFCVPTGNFGNILSGHIARQMGLPIEQLILATNENNVLAEFFVSGVYRVRSSAQTLVTSSPSMDISKASNFERFVFDLLDHDAAQTARLFGQVLPETGVIDLSGPLLARAQRRYGFVAGTSTHADRLATIRRLHQRTGLIIDPHTADGVHVAQSHLGGPKLITLETALPVKFAHTIAAAIGRPAPTPPRFARVLDTPAHTIDLAEGDDVERLKQIIAAHVRD